MPLGKDSGHRPDRAVCWSLGFLYMEGGRVSCTPCPVGSTGISKFLSHWWRRHLSLPLEFPGKGLVSVWVPCYGVSMGLPELGNCIDLGCNTSGTKAGSPWRVRRREKEGAASSGPRMEKPVMNQRCWAQDEQDERPVQDPVLLSASPCWLWGQLSVPSLFQFQGLGLPKALRVNVGPVPRLQKHAVIPLFIHSRFHWNLSITCQALHWQVHSCGLALKQPTVYRSW